MHRSVFNEEINVVFKSQLSNYMKVALLQGKKGFKMLYFETVLNEHSLTHTHDPAHTLSLSHDLVHIRLSYYYIQIPKSYIYMLMKFYNTTKIFKFTLPCRTGYCNIY